MNKDIKFIMIVWFVVIVLPMLAITVMQPEIGEEVIKREIEGVHIVTLQDYITPYIIFIFGTVMIYFFASRGDIDASNKMSRRKT